MINKLFSFKIVKQLPALFNQSTQNNESKWRLKKDKKQMNDESKWRWKANEDEKQMNDERESKWVSESKDAEAQISGDSKDIWMDFQIVSVAHIK